MLLTGLWLAISPSVLHFGIRAPDLQAGNLVFGVAIVAVGIGLALAPSGKPFFGDDA